VVIKRLEYKTFSYHNNTWFLVHAYLGLGTANSITTTTTTTNSILYIWTPIGYKTPPGKRIWGSNAVFGKHCHQVGVSLFLAGTPGAFVFQFMSLSSQFCTVTVSR